MRRIGHLTLLAVLACLLLAAPAAAAKKGGGTVNITKAAALPIPDEAPPFGDGVDGVVNSTIEVGKQFKGRKIRDVNVTVQTTGTSNHSSPPQPSGFNGPMEAVDLVAILRAPNGAHTTLFAGLLPPIVMSGVLAPFPSIGPLTLDDEAALAIGIFNPHAADELYAPFAGTARPAAGKELAMMDNGPARGTWTLTMMDVFNGGTSTLTSWRLNVTTGKPFKTK